MAKYQYYSCDKTAFYHSGILGTEFLGLTTENETKYFVDPSAWGNIHRNSWKTGKCPNMKFVYKSEIIKKSL